MAKKGEAARKIFTNAVAVAGTVTGLVVALIVLRDKVAEQFKLEQRWIGALGGVITLVFLWTFWIGPWVRRWWRRRTEAPKVGSEVFRLRPYDAADRATFARDDKEHVRILNWICTATDPLLYLVGKSGSGKTSLLNAFVLPELQDKFGCVCIVVRGVRQPLNQIRRQLLTPNVVWTDPNTNTTETNVDLTGRACAHLNKQGKRLYIVFDQFEYLLIQHERKSPEVQGVLDFIKSVTKSGPTPEPVVLLVMETDYDGRASEFGLPPGRDRENKEYVQLVNETKAKLFLQRGGIESDELCQKLVREASNLEETSGGRLRYITLNFLGIAAEQAPSRVRGAKTGRGLLHATVRAWVMEPEVREYAAAVLRPMISDKEKKMPLSLGEIVTQSGLPKREVERVLRRFEHDGLVRQTDESIWEIPHDFVARLLKRVLDELSSSFKHRMRPWAATIAGGVLLLGMGVGGVALYEKRERTRQPWEHAGGRVEPAEGGGYQVTFKTPGAVVDATLVWLAYLPERDRIVTIDLSNASIRNLSKLPELPALTTLDLRRCGGLTSLSGMPGLPSLKTLRLSECGQLTSLIGMPELTSLTTLELSVCDKLTSLTGMPELKSLKTLELVYCDNLTSLAEVSECPELTQLQVDSDRLASWPAQRTVPKLRELVVYFPLDAEPNRVIPAQGVVAPGISPNLQMIVYSSDRPQFVATSERGGGVRVVSYDVWTNELRQNPSTESPSK